MLVMFWKNGNIFTKLLYSLEGLVRNTLILGSDKAKAEIFVDLRSALAIVRSYRKQLQKSRSRNVEVE